jgi:hypothetical protein
MEERTCIAVWKAICHQGEVSDKSAFGTSQGGRTRQFDLREDGAKVIPKAVEALVDVVIPRSGWRWGSAWHDSEVKWEVKRPQSACEFRRGER